jgi:hypothetical protein
MLEKITARGRMRAILVGTLLWLALAVPVCAIEPGVWDCDGKFGLCRYVSKNSKREIIPARFERAMPFSEGLAAVRIGGRFGYIDERGEIAIQPQFDLAGDFIQGLAEILVGDKTGIINRRGEIVVQPMFQRAIPLTSQVIIAVEGAWRSAYYAGFEKLPRLAESFPFLGKVGLYHVAGHWVRKPDLKHIGEFDREGRGLIWASDRVGVRDRPLYGLLASNGDWIIEPQYVYAGPLMSDRATVRKLVDGVELSGAVDPTGQIKVALGTWSLSYWVNGLAIARESNQSDAKQALIDRNGNILSGRYFDKVDRAETGDISKVLIDGRWAGIDRAGNIVPNADNSKVLGSCPNGVRAISVDGKVQIIDASGQPTSSHLFEPLTGRLACDRPTSVKLNGLWGFVGLDGHLLFDPPPFKNQSEFDGEYAAVSDGRNWGIIDRSGRSVLPMKFDKYLGRRDGLFRLATEGREVWLTATGEERPEPPIKSAASPQILDCGQGLRLVEHDGLWGIVDSDGKQVIVARYRAVNCFKQGVAWVAIDSRRQWCPVDPNGALREMPACRTSHYPYIQTHSSPESFSKDEFENSVLWTRAYLEFGAGRRESPPRWVGDGVRGGSSVIR